MLRFIPAHAGNTLSDSGRRCKRAVHPRACGEHAITPGSAITITGSSPRMRGTPYQAHRGCLPCRFIPAHAGNTGFDLVVLSQFAVHPRACGEHVARVRYNCQPNGSSPRMRGTRAPHYLDVRYWRFIPAHAGNTAISNPRLATTPVHPRACGEHSLSAMKTITSIGSSPRMRGTLFSRLS